MKPLSNKNSLISTVTVIILFLNHPSLVHVLGKSSVFKPPPKEKVSRGVEDSKATNLRHDTSFTTREQIQPTHSSLHMTAMEEDLKRFHKTGLPAGNNLLGGSRNSEGIRGKITELRPEPESLEQVSKEDIESSYGAAMKVDPDFKDSDHQWIRRMGWNGDVDGGGSGSFLASAAGDYDWWAQGYRMLGVFIDCDHSKEADSQSDSGDDTYYDSEDSCSRWMMWASYVNPNYQNGGRAEYFQYGDKDWYKDEEDISENPDSRLDCHARDTEWELIGVYRQEFYQFIEQISKHLWAIDEYEYVVALAGLSYMTNSDCRQIAYDDDGNAIYAGVHPMLGGNFSMALYRNSTCLIPDDDLDMTYDDFQLYTQMQLESGDGADYYDDDVHLSNWENAQEYTLTLLNEVYEEYKYCTLCMDYPTYQDGYFIGDTGTDDGSIINQCWKFHSHDSFACETDCLALADSQGTIVEIKYGSTFYGEVWGGVTGEGSDTHYDHYKQGYRTDANTRFSKFKANLFLILSGILFVTTFLAFAVARASHRASRTGIKSKQSGDKSKALLDDEEKNFDDDQMNRSTHRGDRSRRSRSRKSRSGRSSSRKERGRRDKENLTSSSRSKSRNRSKSKSMSRSKSSKGRSMRSRSRRQKDEEQQERSRRSSGRKRSSSRHRVTENISNEF